MLGVIFLAACILAGLKRDKIYPKEAAIAYSPFETDVPEVAVNVGETQCFSHESARTRFCCSKKVNDDHGILLRNNRVIANPSQKTDNNWDGRICKKQVNAACNTNTHLERKRNSKQCCQRKSRTDQNPAGQIINREIVLIDKIWCDLPVGDPCDGDTFLNDDPEKCCFNGLVIQGNKNRASGRTGDIKYVATNSLCAIPQKSPPIGVGSVCDEHIGLKPEWCCRIEVGQTLGVVMEGEIRPGLTGARVINHRRCKKCTYDIMDTVLIIDDSGSVGGPRFGLLQAWMSAFQPDIIPSMTPITVFQLATEQIVPGRDQWPNWKVHETPGEYAGDIMNLNYGAGQTYTSTAVANAVGAFAERIEENDGEHAGNGRVLIIITDGVASFDGSQSWSPCADENSDIVQRVKDLQLIVIIIGITNGFTPDDVVCLVDKDEYILQVQQFDEGSLNNIRETMQKLYCDSPEREEIDEF